MLRVEGVSKAWGRGRFGVPWKLASDPFNPALRPPVQGNRGQEMLDMTRKGFLGAAAAILSVATVGAMASAAAQTGDGGRPARRAGRGYAALADYLGLTDQQTTEWRALHEQRREQTKPMMEEGRALRKKLREAVEAASPDPKTVGEATLALEAHHKKVRAEREAFRQKLEATLDPAQKEKLKAFEAARGWGQGRGMGRGFRGHGFEDGERQAPPTEG
jgi:Spy/CpxP family protein refolding chaperone